MSTTAENTSTETHEIEKGIFMHIRVMNQVTEEGDPVTVYVFNVTITTAIISKLIIASFLLGRNKNIDRIEFFH